MSIDVSNSSILIDNNLRGHSHELFKNMPIFAPRYTSYPPANYLNDNLSEEKWLECLRLDLGSSTAKNIGLYLHIPFCRSLCFFCACNRVITKDYSVVTPYISALKKEVSSYKSLLPDSINISQLHLGGGTPNYLSPEELSDLINFINQMFPKSQTNFSIELDPRTCSEQHIKNLAELGCSRISVGVQDFDEKVQKSVNRIQSYEMTENLLELAKSNGILTNSIDLIYGLPHQSRTSFEKTLEKVIMIRPSRIALFGYAHVQSHAPGQKAFLKLEMPDNNQRLDLLLDAINFLTANGYRYIGIDHFVLEDDPLYQAYQDQTLGRSFMGYNSSRKLPVIGLGASSISMFPSALVQNFKDINSYQDFYKEQLTPISKGVLRNELDILVGDLIEDVLTVGKVQYSNFISNQHFESVINMSKDELNYFEERGLLNFHEDGFDLTLVGRIFGRVIAQSFDYRQKLNHRLPQSVII